MICPSLGHIRKLIHYSPREAFVSLDFAGAEVAKSEPILTSIDEVVAVQKTNLEHFDADAVLYDSTHVAAVVTKKPISVADR